MTTYQPAPETQTYPFAPWILRGKAILSIQPIDVEKISPMVPPELEITQILPGKTLGGIYLSTYEDGSVLNYNELIVFSGLTRFGDRTGSWITHIYVDNPKSVAGGREIWGLPKQMAQFKWTEGNSRNGSGDRPQVSVYQDHQPLCQLSYRWQTPGVPLLSIPPLLSFSRLGSNLAWFSAQSEATSHLLIDIDLQIPDSSPFAALKLDHPWLGFSLSNLSLQISAPHVLHKPTQQEYV